MTHVTSHEALRVVHGTEIRARHVMQCCSITHVQRKGGFKWIG